MDIVSVYMDVADTVKQDQNGTLGIEEFNRKSRLAEIRLLDWLTGDVSGIQPPEPYTTLKETDWVTPLLKRVALPVEDGALAKPGDYYGYEVLAVAGSPKDDLCAEEVVITGIDTPIELLTSQSFQERTQTYIKRLQPSMKKPIAQLIGKNFEFLPKDLAAVKLVYKAYPVFGEIKVKSDQIYNTVIPDPSTSTNYSWGENARGILVWFISQMYSTSTREDSLLQHLQAEGKTVRG